MASYTSNGNVRTYLEKTNVRRILESGFKKTWIRPPALLRYRLVKTYNSEKIGNFNYIVYLFSKTIVWLILSSQTKSERTLLEKEKEREGEVHGSGLPPSPL